MLIYLDKIKGVTLCHLGLVHSLVIIFMDYQSPSTQGVTPSPLSRPPLGSLEP